MNFCIDYIEMISLIKMSLSKKNKIKTSIGKNVEKWESSHIADGI